MLKFKESTKERKMEKIVELNSQSRIVKHVSNN
jgi:hypothetical protein